MRDKQKQEELTVFGRLAKQSVDDSERWFGDSPCAYSVSHHTLAMIGRVGEFAAVVQEIERGSLNAKDAKVRMAMAVKLTGTFTELLNIAGLLGIDLEKSYQMVRADNEKRFTEARRKRESNGA